jgi:hypothetical protein
VIQVKQIHVLHNTQKYITNETTIPFQVAVQLSIIGGIYHFSMHGALIPRMVMTTQTRGKIHLPVDVPMQIVWKSENIFSNMRTCASALEVRKG